MLWLPFDCTQVNQVAAHGCRRYVNTPGLDWVMGDEIIWGSHWGYANVWYWERERSAVKQHSGKYLLFKLLIQLEIDWALIPEALCARLRARDERPSLIGRFYAQAANLAIRIGIDYSSPKCGLPCFNFYLHVFSTSVQTIVGFGRLQQCEMWLIIEQVARSYSSRNPQEIDSEIIGKF